MASRGKKLKEIATDLLVNQQTVWRWIERFRKGGIGDLAPHKAKGGQAKIAPEWLEEIIKWVKLGPIGCGLDRANWTFAELAEFLFQKKGVHVSETTMREFCHRHGIRPYRPSYKYLRAHPEKQIQAKAEIAELKKSRKRRTDLTLAR
jgi:transposase